MVEHLENNAPLIVAELERWRDLLWEDYLEYKQEERRGKGSVVP